MVTRRFMIAALAVAGACASNDRAQSMAADASVPDASAAAALGSCVEMSTDLPRPPGAALPCELVPPGLTIAK